MGEKESFYSGLFPLLKLASNNDDVHLQGCIFHDQIMIIIIVFECIILD